MEALVQKSVTTTGVKQTISQFRTQSEPTLQFVAETHSIGQPSGGAETIASVFNSYRPSPTV